MRPRMVLVTCLAALLGVAGLTLPTTRAALASLGARSKAVAVFSDPPPAPAAAAAQVVAQPAPPPPALVPPADPGAIRTPGNPSFFSWAYFNRRTGATVGAANSGTGTNTVESMIKAWIASDYLRLQGGRQPDGNTMNELKLMIIDSNDGLAEKYYELDGTNEVVRRLISMCGLTHTTIYPYYWSRTTMTPMDAIRYGNCVANGTAAGPTWTRWILDTMRQVRGTVYDQISTAKQGGRWGIIDGLPPDLAANTSIKNGFTSYMDGWHVNCLAIEQDWVLNVMVRIGSLPAAANVCKSVAQQMIVSPQF